MGLEEGSRLMAPCGLLQPAIKRTIREGDMEKADTGHTRASLTVTSLFMTFFRKHAKI